MWKHSPNCVHRVRVVCSEGPKTISPAHPTDPGTADDDPFRRRRPRPIGRNSGRDPSTREAKARKKRFLDRAPNGPKQKEIEYSINIDSIVTGQGRNGRSSAKVVFNCLDRIARRTTSCVPGHQETQVCHAGDLEGIKESKEEHKGSW